MSRFKTLIELSLSGLKRIKYYAIANTVVFVLGIILGTMYWDTMGKQIADELYNITKEIIGNPLYTYAYILGHNLLIAIPLGFFLGVTIIAPTIVTLINGLGISAVVVYMQEEVGVPILLSIYAMLPHGVFEVPALLLATSCGIDFGVSTWKRILRKMSNEEYKQRLREELALITVVVILLVIAAAVETSLIVLASFIGEIETPF